MKPVFIDTSPLIAIGNKRDNFHFRALKIRNELIESQRTFVTTNAVLFELGNAFSSVNIRSSAIKLIEAIQQSKKWKCIFIDEDLMKKGLHKFKQVKDKEWGLVDCSSMVVSNKLGISEIFTTDYHFEQAGFTILLKYST